MQVQINTKQPLHYIPKPGDVYYDRSIDSGPWLRFHADCELQPREYCWTAIHLGDGSWATNNFNKDRGNLVPVRFVRTESDGTAVFEEIR